MYVIAKAYQSFFMFHIKSTELAKQVVAFIVKQSQ